MVFWWTFYKKYPFTINLDDKTIGFYLDKKDIFNKKNDIKNFTNNKDKNIIMNENNSKLKNVLIRITEILLGIAFGNTCL